MGLIEKIFGNYSQKELKRIDPLVKKVLALEDTYRNMSEEDALKELERIKAETPVVDYFGESAGA